MQDQTLTFSMIQAEGTNVATPQRVTVSAEALEAWPCDKRQPFAQQGDLYFYKCGTLPPGLRQERQTGQLAPGITHGSRHCVDLRHVRLYHLPQPTAVEGPIIDAPDGVVITHPEHGSLVFPPGIYGVTYQRQYADELRRVTD